MVNVSSHISIILPHKLDLFHTKTTISNAHLAYMQSIGVISPQNFSKNSFAAALFGVILNPYRYISKRHKCKTIFYPANSMFDRNSISIDSFGTWNISLQDSDFILIDCIINILYLKPNSSAQTHNFPIRRKQLSSSCRSPCSSIGKCPAPFNMTISLSHANLS